MGAPDEIVHQQIRLRIMATLNALADRERVEFGRLKAILRATDGNLGAHLTTLESAGYIAIEKDFVGKKPRTRVALTRAGRKAFAAHVAYLRDILDGASPGESK
jgi:DNA-binding MarR family transcriptional regulator